MPGRRTSANTTSGLIRSTIEEGQRAGVFRPQLNAKLLAKVLFGALDEMTRERMNSEVLRIWEQTGKTVVTGCQDKTARLWDAATGLEKASMKGGVGEVTSITFAPDGTRGYIATGPIGGMTKVARNGDAVPGGPEQAPTRKQLLDKVDGNLKKAMA